MKIKKVLYFIALILILFSCNERKVTSYVHQIFDPDRGMILIPAGEFIMGSDNININESPEHVVYLDAYYIDENPVTNQEYYEFWKNLNGNRKELFAPRSFSNNTWPERTFIRPRNPVVGISWYIANLYASEVGKRLPTEAEWEKATKGLTDRKYPWGNEAPDYRSKFRANFNTEAYKKDGFDYTSPVGYYNGKNLNTVNGRSYFELNDMAGNVCEWVNDWYSEDYYGNSRYKNPTGPTMNNSNGTKVIRGGSFKSSPEDLENTHRKFIHPALEENYIGFRLANYVE